MDKVGRGKEWETYIRVMRSISSQRSHPSKKKVWSNVVNVWQRPRYVPKLAIVL